MQFINPEPQEQEETRKYPEMAKSEENITRKFLLETEKEIEGIKGKMFNLENGVDFRIKETLKAADKIILEHKMQIVADETIMKTFYSDMKITRTIRNWKVIIIPDIERDDFTNQIASMKLEEQSIAQETENIEHLERQMNNIRESHKEAQDLIREIEEKYEEIKSTYQDSAIHLSSMRARLSFKIKKCNNILDQLQDFRDIWKKIKNSIENTEKTTRKLRALASNIVVSAVQKLIDEQYERKENWSTNVKSTNVKSSNKHVMDIKEKIEALTHLLDKYRESEAYLTIRRNLNAIDDFVRRISEMSEQMKNLKKEIDDNNTRIGDVDKEIVQLNSKIESIDKENQLRRMHKLLGKFGELKKEIKILKKINEDFHQKLENWKELTGPQRQEIVKKCKDSLKEGDKWGFFTMQTGKGFLETLFFPIIDIGKDIYKTSLNSLMGIDAITPGLGGVFFAAKVYNRYAMNKELMSDIKNIIESIENLDLQK